MSILIVVNNPKDWPIDIPSVKVVSARSYIADPSYSELRGAKVFNLCRSYIYQSVGYYVSLLATARGHKPQPNIMTIQDMKSPAIVRVISEELDDRIQRDLASIRSGNFVLSVYFGRNIARKYDRICRDLFNYFQAPLLRARFSRNQKWHLHSIGPIPASEVPDEHWDFVLDVAREHFSKRRISSARRVTPGYDLAILYDAEDPEPPSDEKALRRFLRAAESLGFDAQLITKDDYGRLAEFDALFIRETTYVNHHTYRFSSRAAAEGLVVVDDPESIIRCTNKVYLAELLGRHEIPAPETLVVHRDNVDMIVPLLGLPVILKLPDSSFSQGVMKVEDSESLNAEVEEFLKKSDLIIAQQFVPTPFDWRVGIFDRQPLYVSKYYMAKKHWQIINREHQSRSRYGRVETLAVEEAPKQVIRTALRAANLIGDGLYGVDLKQVGRKCLVMEVNDNPSIDAGYEDAVLRDELYTRIMHVFLRRVELLKQGPGKT